MWFRGGVVIALILAGASGAQAQANDGLSVADTDWAWWRGPNRNGVAAAGQNLPATWSDAQNVRWKVPVPGRGHGSPTVVGDRVFLAVADEAKEIQSVMCFDRKTGEQRWKTDIHHGGFTSEGRQGHVRSTKASSTVACDGERLFINFINDNAIHLTALDLEGKQLWQEKVSDYVVHQGYGASPSLYGPLVIVSADHKGGGVVSAYERATGKLAWTQKRPELPNYTSPIIVNAAGRDQVVLVGCEIVSSFDPMTGEKLWEIPGATTECVTSTVTDGQLVFTSGGYPKKHIAAVRADGSGEVVWENETQVYVPSMLVRDGYLYAVTDSGEALCYEAATGKLMWEHRIRGNFAASPILVGDTIYAVSSKGITHMFKANPTAFESAGDNTLVADEVEATPVICGGEIFMRIAQGEDAARQEVLYCIGQ